MIHEGRRYMRHVNTSPALRPRQERGGCLLTRRTWNGIAAARSARFETWKVRPQKGGYFMQLWRPSLVHRSDQRIADQAFVKAKARVDQSLNHLACGGNEATLFGHQHDGQCSLDRN